MTKPDTIEKESNKAALPIKIGHAVKINRPLIIILIMAIWLSNFIAVPILFIPLLRGLSGNTAILGVVVIIIEVIMVILFLLKYTTIKLGIKIYADKVKVIEESQFFYKQQENEFYFKNIIALEIAPNIKAGKMLTIISDGKREYQLQERSGLFYKGRNEQFEIITPLQKAFEAYSSNIEIAEAE